MNTQFKFYANEHGTPVLEIKYEDGEAYYLMPFRMVKFQVCMTDDGLGAAGDSSNMYFSDVKKCMDIGMENSDKYWVEEFAIETLRNVITASARDALFDHFHCPTGANTKIACRM